MFSGVFKTTALCALLMLDPSNASPIVNSLGHDSSVHDPTTPKFPAPRPALNYTLCGQHCSACTSNQAPKAEEIVPRDLTRRAFVKPDQYASIDAFMVGETHHAAQQGNLVPLVEPISTGIYRPFGPDPFNVAVQGLYGCASLIVVSMSGVYMTHFWEASSLYAGMSAFQGNVIQPLRQGGSRVPSLRELTRHHGPFDPNGNVIAFIVSVAYPNTGGRHEMYKNQMEELDEVVAGWIPGVEIQHVTYERGNSQSDRNNRKGRVLIQYDPRASTSRRHGVLSGFRLYVEGNEVKTQKWPM